MTLVGRGALARAGSVLLLGAGVALAFSCTAPVVEERACELCNEGESLCPCLESDCCGCQCTGTVSCVPEGIKNCIDYSCFEITPCAERDSCVRDSFGPVCADSAEDCEKVRDGYNWTIASQNLMGGVVRSGEPGLPPGYDLQCHAEDGCTLMPGHCDSGLDTCWLVMPPYMKPELDRLAALYERLGCPPLSDCSCTPMPSEFVCAFEPDRQLGRCVGN